MTSATINRLIKSPPHNRFLSISLVIKFVWILFNWHKYVPLYGICRSKLTIWLTGVIKQWILCVHNRCIVAHFFNIARKIPTNILVWFQFGTLSKPKSTKGCYYASFILMKLVDELFVLIIANLCYLAIYPEY